MTPQTYLNPPLRFSRDEFRYYINKLDFSAWKPRMPYLHNTGVPSLEQIKPSAEQQWAINLENYYRGLGWHAGPHAIAMPDDIIVLCDCTKPGVAESCSNQYAWAIEMIGNFESGADVFSTGDGALVRDNAAWAIACVANKMNWGDLADYAFNVKGLHFHRDCVADHHACPGSLVQKPDMLWRIADFRAALLVPEKEPSPPDKSLIDMVSAADPVTKTALLKLLQGVV